MKCPRKLCKWVVVLVSLPRQERQSIMRVAVTVEAAAFIAEEGSGTRSGDKTHFERHA